MVALMVKRVLMVAFHMPPVQGSSGVQRTLKFARYLPKQGWEPIVLSAQKHAYPAVHDGQTRELDGLNVIRAFALDTARHLAVGGRYPDVLAMPDRWVSWWLGAVCRGLSLIRRYRPQVLWSTYPIATAHLIGLTLQRLSGLPWIADFRDSMTEEGYPSEPLRRRMFSWIECHTVARCARAVFTTPGAVRMYAQRYPHIPRSRWVKIENGYDEENFRDASVAARKPGGGPRILVHSGLLYPSERDPRAFFCALSELKREGKIDATRLKVILRATGHDEVYAPMLRQQDIADIVVLSPAVGYREALSEMLAADGLLLFQASNCNHQIPAKLYEYFRARRPILALTDTEGDTATTLRAAGYDQIYPLHATPVIKDGLVQFLKLLDADGISVGDAKMIVMHSREGRTTELARLLDAIVQEPEAAHAGTERRN